MSKTRPELLAGLLDVSYGGLSYACCIRPGYQLGDALSRIGLVKAGLDINQHALVWIDALSLRFGRRAVVAPHLETGLRGEEEAFFYLRRHGYVVVARRWRTPKVLGDVDLIAWEGDTLCFVEVKTRSRRDIVPAEFAVDQQKQKMLRSMASVFRKRFPEEARRKIPIRFDVISVYLANDGVGSQAEIEHSPTAFAYHTG